MVVALFEGGEHGNLAAPIVRDVIKAYFDKKVRSDPQQSARVASVDFRPGVIAPQTCQRPPVAVRRL